MAGCRHGANPGFNRGDVSWLDARAREREHMMRGIFPSLAIGALLLLAACAQPQSAQTDQEDVPN
jgi:hypothetical protein